MINLVDALKAAFGEILKQEDQRKLNASSEDELDNKSVADSVDLDPEADTDIDATGISAREVISKDISLHTNHENDNSRSHHNNDIDKNNRQGQTSYTVLFQSNQTGLEIGRVLGQISPEVVSVAKQSDAERYGVKVNII